MNKSLPPLFLQRLKNIVPPGAYRDVIKSFSMPNVLSVRVNTLKVSKEAIVKALHEQKIDFKDVPWSQSALILDGITSRELGEKDIVKKGMIYRQGLSSMLPVIALDPKPGEHILDMCAAPGGKTSQIAAYMNNQGTLIGLESVRGRYYKLKMIARLLGVTNASFFLMDARKYRCREQLFDRILVDAPCSSEGRFQSSHPKTFRYWSLRKIKEMTRKQKGLLLAATRLLKPEGILVYSTCTFAPEENESVVQWVLKKTEGNLQIEKFAVNGIESYPAIGQWQDRVFDQQIKECLRVLPNQSMEGFFICRFKKNQ